MVLQGFPAELGEIDAGFAQRQDIRHHQAAAGCDGIAVCVYGCHRHLDLVAASTLNTRFLSVAANPDLARPAPQGSS